MPISRLLSHEDARAESIKDIHARRLSTGDMYAYAIHTMSRHLDEVRTLVIESELDGYEDILTSLQTLMSKVESVVAQQNGDAGGYVDLRSARGLDLALASYTVLRDGVSTMYREHPGAEHRRSCAVCVGLWLCAGVISAVEQFLAEGMAEAKRKMSTVHGGHHPHRCILSAVTSVEGQKWHVNCPSCGTVAQFPMSQATKASEAAIRHRRSKAGAPVRSLKGR